jgi:hypothetical protein
VTPKNIMGLWQAGKLTHEACKKELVRSRGNGLSSCYSMVEFVENKEKSARFDVEIEDLRNKLSSKLLPFKQNDVVDEWKAQYQPSNYGTLMRYKLLLLRGKSRSGKTVFAKSLFGPDQTVVLNCQGLGDAIPSMREVDRTIHKCVVFDEVSEGQILDNKALFQAGMEKVQLSQSQCGGFRYEIWPYGLAFVLCSNMFKLTRDEGLEDEEHEDWLLANIMTVERPAGDTWFVPHEAVGRRLAHAGT